MDGYLQRIRYKFLMRHEQKMLYSSEFGGDGSTSHTLNSSARQENRQEVTSEKVSGQSLVLKRQEKAEPNRSSQTYEVSPSVKPKVKTQINDFPKLGGEIAIGIAI